jgi:hypothetical protein
MRYDSSGLVTTGQFETLATFLVVKMRTGAEKKKSHLILSWSFYHKNL